MRKGKRLAAACMMLSLAAGMTGCDGSKNYADGTYEGKSTVYENEDGDSEDGNGYGVVSITIKENKIVDCTFQTYETDGKLKDEDYGKADGEIANRDYYNKAQKAVAACEQYATMLIGNGELDGIDAISGATINYNEFKEAVTAALREAETD
ncbi:MAG: FMN-binding protein [Lachnospiraceae bacterium]|nr:FMN-binding protein [Lachnospiraceae bacterium]